VRKADDRVKLLFGPYQAPALSKGGFTGLAGANELFASAQVTSAPVVGQVHLSAQQAQLGRQRQDVPGGLTLAWQWEQEKLMARSARTCWSRKRVFLRSLGLAKVEDGAHATLKMPTASGRAGGCVMVSDDNRPNPAEQEHSCGVRS
jgi:hypothetical protein